MEFLDFLRTLQGLLSFLGKLLQFLPSFCQTFDDFLDHLVLTTVFNFQFLRNDRQFSDTYLDGTHVLEIERNFLEILETSRCLTVGFILYSNDEGDSCLKQDKNN